jgi:lysozyme
VVGIDVSAHQGAVAWKDVADDGVAFAFVKATEGCTFTDRRFADNWGGAREAGLQVGAYHYFSACRTGAEQARHFLAVVGRNQGDLPAVVDVEPDSRCNRGHRWAGVADEVAVWLDTVEHATGQRPLLYASDHVHRHELAELDVDRWVASYSRAPRVPSWGVWQHTERGRIDGVDGPVDRNLATAAWWAEHGR